ncbi:protein ANTI-SILENCING 1 [Beta vulgaris subsp. vulgaris]|uniref:protein ANTI-SILENCING 1 n=1 Tax=Beta vulgaris subsp. vulgaris TaxID=3555 RepID=UPI00203764FB|nr:protein ANTI-SILENCING 1 [Beta vulgaris subsp. vulgaris]XP_048492829.1 protein ANTI-SILENCING 1 [Beta vulgaris subsp. vulgaris]
MSNIVEENFQWGRKIEITSTDGELYSSFTYEGVEYSRFESIFMYREGARETDIGILTKIWRTKKGGKRGKVNWFFRPVDICNYLGDHRPSWNHLFLASGQGKGVSNIIPLEAIIGKCNVVCISKDSRIITPSKSDLEKADYVFSHVFDVEDRKVSAILPDRIDNIRVERVLNWNRDKPKASAECSPRYMKEEIPTIPEGQPLKKRKIVSVSEADSLPLSQDGRKWFCELPWEEKVKEAHEHGTLVHMVNLDPSYTSSDVQDIIWSAFKLKVDAKIMPPRHSFKPSYGEALVIFKSEDDADFVIFELDRKCLIVGGGRPLIACNIALYEPDKTCNFPGHLIMDRMLKLKYDKRKAVFASHCAQANTIEHDMAMQWRVFQKRSDLWWEALLKNQENEISPCLSLMLKSCQSVEHRAAEETQ